MKILCSLLLLTSLLSGCALVDDASTFDIRLPGKELVVDAQQWQLSGQARLPSIPCSTQSDTCATSINQLCAADNCSGQCNPATQACDASILIELVQNFDLRTESPLLRDVDEHTPIRVTLGQMLYQVQENTLSIDSPEFSFFIAPATILSSSASQAQPVIGNLDPIAAGTLPNSTLTMTEDGDERLRTFMENFTTPFNIIVRSKILLSAGDSLPRGQLTALLKIVATVKLF